MSWAILSGISLYYAVLGRGGRSLTLLHELGGSLESLTGVVPPLEQDFRVLRFDQRGAGWSVKPRLAFTLDDHAADLARLLAATGLEPFYALAGIAASAAIPVAFARPSEVEALCAPALSVPADRRYLAERDGMRAVADKTLDRSYPDIMQRNPVVFEAYRARFLANDPVSYAHANMALAEAGLENRLGTADVPCLVLAGRYDLLRTPGHVREVADRIPGVAFEVIDSVHLMRVQAPEELGARLRAFFGAVRRSTFLHKTQVSR